MLWNNILLLILFATLASCTNPKKQKRKPQSNYNKEIPLSELVNLTYQELEQKYPAETPAKCTNTHDLDKLFSNKASLALHCSPLIIAAGMSAGSAIASKTAGTKAGQVVASKVVLGTGGKAIGKLATRLILGANLAGGTIASYEIMKVVAGLQSSARDCQTYEVALKTSIYDEIDNRGQAIESALEKAGFPLSIRQKSRLLVPGPKRERLSTASCGEVNIFARKMMERQNRVYSELLEGTMANVPFPEPSKKIITKKDSVIIGELYNQIHCFNKEDALKTLCAIGNLVIIGKTIPQEVRRLRKPKQSKAISNISKRDLFLSYAIRNDLRFPQSTFGNVGGRLNGLFNKKFNLKDTNKDVSEEEMDRLYSIAVNAHKKHKIDAPFDKGGIHTLMFEYKLTTKNVYENWLKTLQKVSQGKLKNGYLLDGPKPALDQFVKSQDSDGTDYLLSFGESLNDALNSKKMTQLSKKWKSFLASKDYSWHRSVQIKGGDDFESIIKSERYKNIEQKVEDFHDSMPKILEEKIKLTHPELDKLVPGYDRTYLQLMLQNIQGNA